LGAFAFRVELNPNQRGLQSKELTTHSFLARRNSLPALSFASGFVAEMSQEDQKRPRPP
jgi:hypothetical protein